jgi:hypothetical protein
MDMIWVGIEDESVSVNVSGVEDDKNQYTSI